jgi:hypothetical protein
MRAGIRVKRIKALVSYLSVQKYSVQGKSNFSGTILPKLPPTDPSTVVFNFAFNKFDKHYKDKFLSH